MIPPVAARPELRLSPWVLTLPLAMAALGLAGAVVGSGDDGKTSVLTNLPVALAGLTLYLIVLGIALACTVPSPDSKASLGVVRPARWGAALRLAAGLVLGGLVLGVVADRLLHATDAQGIKGTLAHGDRATLAIVVSLAAYAVLGPIVEELVFRGLVTAAIRQRLGPAVTPVATGVLFALAHGDPRIVVALVPLGIALGLLYEHTGSIVPGMVAHMTYNAIGVTIALLSG